MSCSIFQKASCQPLAKKDAFDFADGWGGLLASAEEVPLTFFYSTCAISHGAAHTFFVCRVLSGAYLTKQPVNASDALDNNLSISFFSTSAVRICPVHALK